MFRFPSLNSSTGNSKKQDVELEDEADEAIMTRTVTRSDTMKFKDLWVGIADPEDANAPQLITNFSRARDDEREYLDERKREWDIHDRQCIFGSEGLAVAMSGGGLRASSQALGVLWFLRSKGHLQDIQYLSSVSGGGYSCAGWMSRLMDDWGPEGSREREAELEAELRKRLDHFDCTLGLEDKRYSDSTSKFNIHSYAADKHGEKDPLMIKRTEAVIRGLAPSSSESIQDKDKSSSGFGRGAGNSTELRNLEAHPSSARVTEYMQRDGTTGDVLELYEEGVEKSSSGAGRGAGNGTELPQMHDIKMVEAMDDHTGIRALLSGREAWWRSRGYVTWRFFSLGMQNVLMGMVRFFGKILAGVYFVTYVVVPATSMNGFLCEGARAVWGNECGVQVVSAVLSKSATVYMGIAGRAVPAPDYFLSAGEIYQPTLTYRSLIPIVTYLCLTIILVIICAAVRRRTKLPRGVSWLLGVQGWLTQLAWLQLLGLFVTVQSNQQAQHSTHWHPRGWELDTWGSTFIRRLVLSILLALATGMLAGTPYEINIVPAIQLRMKILAETLSFLVYLSLTAYATDVLDIAELQYPQGYAQENHAGAAWFDEWEAMDATTWDIDATKIFFSWQFIFIWLGVASITVSETVYGRLGKIQQWFLRHMFVHQQDAVEPCESSWCYHPLCLHTHSEDCCRMQHKEAPTAMCKLHRGDKPAAPIYISNSTQHDLADANNYMGDYLIPRRCEAFEITSKRMGSDLVGYWRTPVDLDIMDAVAVSGAATSATTGTWGNYTHWTAEYLNNTQLVLGLETGQFIRLGGKKPQPGERWSWFCKVPSFVTGMFILMQGLLLGFLLWSLVTTAVEPFNGIPDYGAIYAPFKSPSVAIFKEVTSKDGNCIARRFARWPEADMLCKVYWTKLIGFFDPRFSYVCSGASHFECQDSDLVHLDTMPWWASIPRKVLWPPQNLQKLTQEPSDMSCLEMTYMQMWANLPEQNPEHEPTASNLAIIVQALINARFHCADNALGLLVGNYLSLVVLLFLLFTAQAWCGKSLLICIPALNILRGLRHCIVLPKIEMRANDGAANVFLADGGHIDNSAVLPLLKRQHKRILAMDAAENRKLISIRKILSLAQSELGVSWSPPISVGEQQGHLDLEKHLDLFALPRVRFAGTLQAARDEIMMAFGEDNPHPDKLNLSSSYKKHIKHFEELQAEDGSTFVYLYFRDDEALRIVFEQLHSDKMKDHRQRTQSTWIIMHDVHIPAFDDAKWDEHFIDEKDIDERDRRSVLHLQVHYPVDSTMNDSSSELGNVYFLRGELMRQERIDIQEGVSEYQDCCADVCGKRRTCNCRPPGGYAVGVFPNHAVGPEGYGTHHIEAYAKYSKKASQNWYNHFIKSQHNVECNVSRV